MLTTEQARRYAWADEDHDLVWTLAVITGCDWRDVMRAYGGDPTAEAPLMPFADAHVNEDEVGTFGYVQVRNEGAFVLVIENNGWLGNTADVAERASVNGGHFISVYWGQRTDLIEANDGRIAADFEPLFANEVPGVGDIHPDWLPDVEFTKGSLRSMMMAVVEWRAGLAFDRAWLYEAMPTRIPYAIGEAPQQL